MHRGSVSAEYQPFDTQPLDPSTGAFSVQQYYDATQNQLQHHQILPAPPLNTTQQPAHTNTFVHKLYNMVVDTQYQHLISWAYTGSSFIVCNIMEFSKDVLPKHFKHNNFSSFFRQLNMYGFHKLNKFPRGHRTLAENQIWEFSHSKFLRNRPDLLDDIKRKSMEAEGAGGRENGDQQDHFAILQASQSEMTQQIQVLYENFIEIIKELEDTKQKQENQMQCIKSMMNFISQQNGGQLPNDFAHIINNHRQFDMKQLEKLPSIVITSHEPNLLNDLFATKTVPQQQYEQQPLSVHAQNIEGHGSILNPHYRGNQLPPSPSPSMLVSDDECLYSPNSPHIPRHHHQHSYSYSSTNSSSSFINTPLDPLLIHR